MRDYYCSQKFDWLEVRLHDGWVTSCCKATPDKVSAQFLESNPQGFFNWPKLIDERKQMLNNQRVDGCESACWQPEDQGLYSRRTSTPHAEYTGLHHLPKHINIITSNTCNMTCSYCCKHYSSSWTRDVIENGDYNITGYEDRYNANFQDQAVYRSSQKLLDQTRVGNLIMDQIEANMEHVETLMLVGGEPLLYSRLEQLLEKFVGKEIVVFTGLGINQQRLKKLLPLLERHNATISISAENTHEFHEFNRYGYSYNNFVYNVDMIRQHCNVMFNSVISNITLFDFANFARLRVDDRINANFAHDPKFFATNLLDPASKREIQAQLKDLPQEFVHDIAPTLDAEPNLLERDRLSAFLKRFVSTRKLSLDIFPSSFLSWLDQAQPLPKTIPIRVQQ
jgi:MoaA/NifB/PqqE/SkfB family radical SAM enzyme